MMSPSILMYIFVYLSGFIMFFHFNEWFVLWVSMELVMYGFLVLSFNPSNLEVEESCYKYFFVQSLGSGALLGLMYLGVHDVVMEIVLFYKIGLGPFYYWYLSVMGGLGWVSCFVLMTIQKLIPMVMLREMDFFVGWIFIVVSLAIGLLGSLGQVILKDLLVYSSLHYMGWILLMEMMEGEFWMIYFFMYSFMLGCVVVSFSRSGCLMVGEVGNKHMIPVVLSLFVLGGVPPFLGFVLKWVGFVYLLGLDMMMVVVLAVFSVIMCYVYFRVGINMVLVSGGLGSAGVVDDTSYYVFSGVVSGWILYLWGSV
uniref:NADH-ubiquinone oxidoreductase chain 2 n=1 Tax=Pholcus sp. HCP-2014 TaxID=1519082 RepID=A0A0U1V1C3_9ARAC|nr:NADH dehydrogenase subunit 2 [Pholcus sp. HCP-2014]